MQTASLAIGLMLASPFAVLAQVDEKSSAGTQTKEVNKNILAPAQPIIQSPVKVEPVTGETTSGAQKSMDAPTGPPPETDEPQAEPANALSEMQRKLEEMAELQKQTKNSQAASADNSANAQKPAVKKKSPQLFGRIEQIASETDVKMPTLKAMTPELDPRDKRLQAKVDETKYSGSVAKQFPDEFQGQWGGVLQVWSLAYSPLYLQMDRAQVVQTAKILRKGRSGNVNFNFRKDRFNRIALEPAAVLLSVPMKDLHSYDQMMAGGTGGGLTSQMGPFGGSFQQVVGNMEMPAVKIYFGDAATDGVMQKGISGNQFRQDVVKNVIRQLSADVVEQQILTQAQDRVAGTGKLNTYYDESVLRFKKLSYDRLYVTAASVKYTNKGKYLSKMIMYGTVNKGRLVQTDPMSDMNKMMGSMMNLQQLQGMFGGGTPGKPVNTQSIPGGIPSMPNMPNGFNPYDILKKMNQ